LLQFKHPKQVRFQEDPNAEFVKRMRRSRSRSENEREKMHTDNHRTDFNQFLKNFKNQYIEKRR
jgi:hypothetical protein